MIFDKNLRAWVLKFFTSNKWFYSRKRKHSWEPFRICLLNSSTANPVQFWWKWARLALLFSWQIPNGPDIVFSFPGIRLLINVKIVDTHALTFLLLIMLASAGVNYDNTFSDLNLIFVWKQTNCLRRPSWYSICDILCSLWTAPWINYLCSR